MSGVVFWIAMFVTLGAALVAVTRRNPFQAGLALLVCALAAAALQATLGAVTLAAFTAVIAAVWALLLLVFAVMTASLPETELEDERVSKPGLVAAAFFVTPLLALCCGVLFSRGPAPLEAGGVAPPLEPPGENLAVVVLAAALLAAAVVGATILSRRRS